MAGAGVAAGKAVGGDQRNFDPAPARLGALRVGDASQGAGGLPAGASTLDEHFRRRLGLAEDVAVGPRLGEALLGGGAALGGLRTTRSHRVCQPTKRKQTTGGGGG